MLANLLHDVSLFSYSSPGPHKKVSPLSGSSEKKQNLAELFKIVWCFYAMFESKPFFSHLPEQVGPH
jgi:hypothetical protein